MHITIDSDESLDKVLAVVGALYGVALRVDDPAPAPATRLRRADAADQPRRQRDTARSRRTTRSPRRTARSTDPALIRSWAKANGHSVRDRGRVPAAVTAAYLAAGAPKS